MVKSLFKKTDIYVVILAILLYANWLTMHYAADTYNIMNIGYYQYALRNSLIDGRVFMAIITCIADKVNLSINVYVIGTLFLAIIILSLCVIKIKNIVLRNKEASLKTQIIVTCISFFTIFNFMYIDNMYFVECFVMSISLLCFIYAADILVEKNKTFMSTMLTILGIMMYQGTVGFYIAFVIFLLVIKEKKNIAKFLQIVLESVGITAIALLVNVAFVAVAGCITNQVQTRLSNSSKIFSNILCIIDNFGDIFVECCNLFPKYLLLIFLAVIFIITLCYDIKNKTVHIINIFIIIVVTTASSFLISVGTLSSFYAGRMRFGIGALIGLLLMYMYIRIDSKNMKKIVVTVSIIYAIINSVNCVYLTYEHKLVNEYEQQYAENISEYIESEEEKRGIEVNKVAVIYVGGHYDDAFFDEVEIKSAVTCSAFRCKWAADGVINFYTDKELETVYLTEEQLKKYEEESNENGFCIVDDILVIETYIC